MFASVEFLERLEDTLDTFEEALDNLGPGMREWFDKQWQDRWTTASDVSDRFDEIN